MDTNHFLFTFVTPEKEILKQAQVQEILCPSENGELNILPLHAPLIALLKPGVLSYKVKGQWSPLSVSWGFLEVHGQGVRVLAETAETGKEISKIKAEQRLKELYEKLKNPLITPKESREFLRQIEKEQARLDVLS